MGAMLHWILPRIAAYVAVVVAAGLLFLAGASVYALMWPKPVVPFGQMGPWRRSRTHACRIPRLRAAP
jgi:hypothetical protein